MRTRQSPQQRKELSYLRDHVEDVGESRHSFRKKWPKKKAAAHRAKRRIARADLSAIAGSQDAVDSLLLDVRRGKVRPRKWGATPLGEHVRRNQAERLSSARSHVLRRTPGLTAELRHLLARSQEEPRVIRAARFLNSFIQASTARRKVVSRSLYVLFRDEPSWLAKVAKWLKTVPTSRGVVKDRTVQHVPPNNGMHLTKPAQAMKLRR